MEDRQFFEELFVHNNISMNFLTQVQAESSTVTPGNFLVGPRNNNQLRSISI